MDEKDKFVWQTRDWREIECITKIDEQMTITIIKQCHKLTDVAN
jgi:hypothetical protein